jgi:hypothetical protein
VVSPSAEAILDASSGPASLVALADSAIAAAEPELARRALARAADIAPQSAVVHEGYGRYYTATLRYKDAKTEFDHAALLDPSSPEPHYWLAKAYLKAGAKEQAFQSLARALRLDPTHAGARDAIRPLLEDRYRVAGIPTEYATLAERPTVTRGELGVMLAVEMGVDPDHSVWRSDQVQRTDWASIENAWGSRWLRASVGRGWIGPLADADLHLDDPVTRGSLAILLAPIRARAPVTVLPESTSNWNPTRAALAGGSGLAAEFPDLGPRHYLARAAAGAVRLGLPTREGGRFEPQAIVSGYEALHALRGLARTTGAMPIVSGDPDEAALVK